MTDEIPQEWVEAARACIYPDEWRPTDGSLRRVIAAVLPLIRSADAPQENGNPYVTTGEYVGNRQEDLARGWDGGHAVGFAAGRSAERARLAEAGKHPSKGGRVTTPPEIERLRSQSHLADGERVVFIDVAERAVLAVEERRTREIVEALREPPYPLPARDDVERARLIGWQDAWVVASRFLPEGEKP